MVHHDGHMLQAILAYKIDDAMHFYSVGAGIIVIAINFGRSCGLIMCTYSCTWLMHNRKLSQNLHLLKNSPQGSTCFANHACSRIYTSDSPDETN